MFRQTHSFGLVTELNMVFFQIPIEPMTSRFSSKCFCYRTKTLGRNIFFLAFSPINPKTTNSVGKETMVSNKKYCGPLDNHCNKKI